MGLSLRRFAARGSDGAERVEAAEVIALPFVGELRAVVARRRFDGCRAGCRRPAGVARPGEADGDDEGGRCSRDELLLRRERRFASSILDGCCSLTATGSSAVWTTS